MGDIRECWRSGCETKVLILIALIVCKQTNQYSDQGPLTKWVHTQKTNNQFSLPTGDQAHCLISSLRLIKSAASLGSTHRCLQHCVDHEKKSGHCIAGGGDEKGEKRTKRICASLHQVLIILGKGYLCYFYSCSMLCFLGGDHSGKQIHKIIFDGLPFRKWFKKWNGNLKWIFLWRGEGASRVPWKFFLFFCLKPSRITAWLPKSVLHIL